MTEDKNGNVFSEVLESAGVEFTEVGSFKMSSDTAELFAALAYAQADIATPKRDKTAEIKSQKGAYSYSYADLASIRDATRKALKDNGLAVVQMPSCDEANLVSVVTLLTHSSGQWIAPEPLTAIPTQTTPQGIGSIITYLRRYAMSAMLNLATEEDDDAQAASAKPKAAAKTKKGDITAAQSKKLFAVSMERAKKLGIKQREIVDALLTILGYESTKDIQKADVDKCLKFIENYGGHDAVAEPAVEDETARADELDAEEPPF